MDSLWRVYVTCLKVGLILGIGGTIQAEDIQAVWIGSGVTDWNNPANWSGGVVPNNSEVKTFNVIIPPPTTSDYASYNEIIIRENTSISDLTLPQILSLREYLELHIHRDFQWLGGALIGGGSLYLHGNSIFGDETYKTLRGNLVLLGNARWTAGSLHWAGNGRIDIASNAVFQIEAHGHLGAEATTDSAQIYHSGVIRMIAPNKTVQFYTPLHNNGLIDVQSGSFQVLWTYDGQGMIHVGADARFLFSGPTQLASPAIVNKGEILLEGRGPQALEILANTVIPGKSRIAGNIYGSGTLTLEDAEWDSGEMAGDGLVRIPAGGRLRLTNYPELRRSLLNEGEVILQPGAILSVYPRHTNSPTGIVRMTSSAIFGRPYSSAGGYLINHGLVTKDDDSGTAWMAATLQNYGLVNVSRGKLIMHYKDSGSIPPDPEPAIASGTFETQQAGILEVNRVEINSAARLEGDGSIILNFGSFAGTISSNLSLSLRHVKMNTGSAHSVRALQLQGQSVFMPGATMDVAEQLVINGGFHFARLRSHGFCEMSFNSLVLSNGTTLDLLGESAWLGGSLQMQNTNSTIFNTGQMRLLGNTELLLRNNASFLNRSRWVADQSIQTMQLLVGPSASRLITVSGFTGEFPEEGSFHILGPVTVSSQEIVADPGADLVLSDLAVTNASVQISGSRLSATHSLSSSNTVFSLASARITSPSSGWAGSCSLSGSGILECLMRLDNLELRAVDGTNDLQLHGDLELTRTNSNFRAHLFQTDSSLVAPRLAVQGQTTLRGKFNLTADVHASGLIPSTNPVVVLESHQPLSGRFENAPNGALLTTPDGSYQCRIFYGENSPHGANKLVISHFGTAFDQWRLARFSPDQLRDDSISGLSADPDRNGFNNAAEFVLANDPSSTQAPRVFIQSYREGYTLIGIRKRKEIGRLSVSIAVSADLTKWDQTALGSSSTLLQLHRTFDLETAYEYIYRFPQSVSHLFLRILISG